MKEPHRKGVANRSNPESCAGGGNIAGEALKGAHAGQPSSSEITQIGVPTLYDEGEGHMGGRDSRERSLDAAESETLSMRGKYPLASGGMADALAERGGRKCAAKVGSEVGVGAEAQFFAGLNQRRKDVHRVGATHTAAVKAHIAATCADAGAQFRCVVVQRH